MGHDTGLSVCPIGCESKRHLFNAYLVDVFDFAPSTSTSQTVCPPACVQVANRLRPWLRFRAVTSSATRFVRTLTLVQEKWRKTLFKLKYEQFVAMAAPCQSMVRCCLAVHRLAQQRAKVEAKTIVLKAWHNYRLAEVCLAQRFRPRLRGA